MITEYKCNRCVKSVLFDESVPFGLHHDIPGYGLLTLCQHCAAVLLYRIVESMDRMTNIEIIKQFLSDAFEYKYTFAEALAAFGEGKFIRAAVWPYLQAALQHKLHGYEFGESAIYAKWAIFE